jgi:phenol 2-monooxygenase (NADPH)
MLLVMEKLEKLFAGRTGMAQESITTECDAAIIGRRPAGLLVAYQLKRFGVSASVFKKNAKETQDAYGRAIALFPRMAEQLDQLDLADPML